MIKYPKGAVVHFWNAKTAMRGKCGFLIYPQSPYFSVFWKRVNCERCKKTRREGRG